MSKTDCGNDVRERIARAYQLLIERDAHLLAVNANERSLTHRLAMYLEKEFPEYQVDCEYNRNGLARKKIEKLKRKIDSDNTEGVNVYPDIIIHRRGTKNNFIVIEAKKTSNTDQADMAKLKAYKADLSYRHAFFVRFPVGEELKNLKQKSIVEYLEEVA